ncbi:MAG: DNA alkylation repair protein [Micrococcus sp.]|nr:DNA alkylation repair protein [Micrococcus sp.]
MAVPPDPAAPGTADTAAPSVDSVLAELAALEDPGMRAANQKRGDDHGVNLTRLRGVARTIKADPAAKHGLALELWATEDTAARLLALLVCSPKRFSPAELDTMLRQARAPKVKDWLVNYVLKKSRHLEPLRLAWTADPDPQVASAGWDLIAHQVSKKPEVLDLPELLDTIEARLKDAPPALQWSMNTTLATIGIEHPDLRARALDIGERLEVLKDYPTPPNCTSPFAPAWISEIVRRREQAR